MSGGRKVYVQQDPLPKMMLLFKKCLHTLQNRKSLQSLLHDKTIHELGGEVPIPEILVSHQLLVERYSSLNPFDYVLTQGPAHGINGLNA